MWNDKKWLGHFLLVQEKSTKSHNILAISNKENYNKDIKKYKISAYLN